MFRWFENLIDPYDTGPADAPPPQSFWQFAREWLWPFRWAYVGAMLGTAGIALTETLMVAWIGKFVDLLSSADPKNFWQIHGTEMLVIAFTVLVARPLAGALRALMLSQVISANVAASTRWRGHRRLLNQGVSFFADDSAGRLQSRVMSIGPSLHDALHNFIEAIWYAVLYLGATLWLLGEVDRLLLIPVVLWLVGFLAFGRYAVPRIGRNATLSAEARGTLAGRIVDAYANIALVKLYGSAGREEAFAREAIEEVRQTAFKELRLFTTLDVGLSLLNGFLTVGTLGLAVWLWSQGLATAGAVAVASALIVRLASMSGSLMWISSVIATSIGGVRDGMQSFVAPLRAPDKPHARAITPGPGAISIREARFTYGRGNAGIQGINLEIRAGERIGLVGASGAGKSTLIGCLLRLHPLESGQILIDGQDIAELTQDSVRARMAVVSQDTSMFHRPVRENIRYGRPWADDAAVIAAAQAARAHEFITALQDNEGLRGYDARVGERGIKLSGGQRQRIAISRAILKDAPILILDEATSALDSEVEAEIQAELVGLMQNRTVIAIAHRLSTIAHLDRIAVMEAGRITELGTHAELLRKGGLYARFWERQSGGFLGAQG